MADTLWETLLCICNWFPVWDFPNKKMLYKTWKSPSEPPRVMLPCGCRWSPGASDLETQTKSFPG